MECANGFDGSWCDNSNPIRVKKFKGFALLTVEDFPQCGANCCIWRVEEEVRRSCLEEGRDDSGRSRKKTPQCVEEIERVRLGEGCVWKCAGLLEVGFPGVLGGVWPESRW